MSAIRRESCCFAPKADRHDFGQLVVPLARPIDLDVDTRRINLDRTQAVWLPAGASHRVAGLAAPALLVELSAGETIDSGLHMSGEVQTLKLAPAARDFCRYLAGLAEADNALADPVRRHSLGLLGTLVPEWATPASDPLSQAYTTLASPLDNRPIEQIARGAFLSPSQFRRRFFARYAVSPRLVRSQARLGWLCRQLEETDRSVGRLAQMLGYDNTATLTNFFRRAMNTTPSDYRARYVNKMRE